MPENQVTITINIDNAAFAIDAAAEVARLLKDTAARVEAEGLFGYFPLRDTNGNTVGSLKLTETE